MIDASSSNTKIIHPGVCISVDDPLVIGRIRAHPSTRYINDIVKASFPNEEFDIPGDIPSKYFWTKRDPFVYNSLIPYFFRQVPRVGEYVHIIYSNPGFQDDKNKFYVQGPISSPTLQYKDVAANAEQLLTLGDRVKSMPNLKNSDGSYKNPKTQSIFPDPNDVAILGRYNTDIILKDEDIILRAGKAKSIGLKNANGSTFPYENPRRSFIQLSNLQTTTSEKTIKKVFKAEQTEANLTYLVEWDIINLNSSANFTGSIYFYRLDAGQNTKTKDVLPDTVIDGKILAYKEDFQGLSMSAATEFINTTITKFKNSTLTISPSLGNVFPFYYRPDKSVLDATTQTSDPLSLVNALSFQSQIGVSLSSTESSGFGGFGLIFSKEKKGNPIQIKQINLEDSKTSSDNSTVQIFGADKFYFISHQSTIPGKNKINLEGTNYGVSGDFINENVVDNVSSMVRGEELLELLNYIIQYLITHVHSYHGLPPVPTTTNGSTTTELMKKMMDAYQKVLSQNFKLN
jgi:hypothetical protein